MILTTIHADPVLSKFVILSLVIIGIGFMMRLFKQPTIITYIIVGVLVGPFGFQMITEESIISNLGSLGLVLLLFFIGMEIHLAEFIANWRISLLGTLIQVTISLVVVWGLGHYFNWNMAQTIMLGFVLSLSSTAVIVKLLQERGELNQKAGQNALSVLVAQDILIVPMIIIMGYLGGHEPTKTEILKQIIGGALIIGVILFVIKKKEVKLPFRNHLLKDHEMQVFMAFTICFGFSVLSAFLGLSSALGAFIAGIIVSSARSTKWVHDSLLAFKVMFVALFFVSIGMLIDLNFIVENWMTIGALVLVVFLINSTINTIVMKIFCKDWRISIYSAALLAQIGEFSFVLGSTGFHTGIIGEYMYQLVVSSIALSLLFSPFWISLARRLTMSNARVK